MRALLTIGVGLGFGLGAAARAADKTDAVMLAPAVGTEQRLSDVTQPPHRPSLPDELNLPGAVYWGLFKVCVGTEGTVTDVHVLRSTGEPQRLDARWIEAAKTWRYKPYELEGRKRAFCHPLRLQIGAAGAAAPAADGSTAGDEPVTVKPAIGMAQRLSDLSQAPHKPPLPDDLNKHGAVYWGLFKVCVSAAGDVSGVTVVRSTGEPQRLDPLWIAAIKTWRYRSYTVNGRPVPFCSPIKLKVSAS